MTKIKTLSYTQELADDMYGNMVECFQTGETVCGTLDPCVMELGTAFAELYPDLAGLTTVRVIDKFVSPWQSDTILEFSDRDITAEEYAQYEEYANGLE